MGAHRIADGVMAGTIAGIASGLPSTLTAIVTGSDPLEATYAAGSMLLPEETDRTRLIAAAAVVHGSLSVVWGVVLAQVLPRKATVLSGALAGLAIAAVDLGFVGPRFPRVAALRPVPQIADHVAFGVIAGAVVAARRARRAPGSRRSVPDALRPNR
ncbi:MAG TPA: hypothetical protein VFK89_08400 [Actinomycetota bacterium]|nr:hypothetical protein [Actinomycetota bacterium]